MSLPFVHKTGNLALPAEVSVNIPCFLKSLSIIVLLAIFNLPMKAQELIPTVRVDTVIISPAGNASDSTGIYDSLHTTNASETGDKASVANNFTVNNWDSSKLTPKQIRSRVRIVAISNVAGYSAILAGLSAAWYSNYEKSKLHSFNDNKEWLQIDKVGHMYGAYIESRTSMELWRWTGMERKKRIWLGGLSGILYQTIIETLDGFSAGWGWSWGDIGANITGSGALIAQELAWNEQRIQLKFSFHIKNYGDAGLNNRADKIYGSSFSERFVKDYNAHTFWASTNLRSFFPKSKLPSWLAVAVGYGAEGMFGANGNTAKDKDGNIVFDRSDIKRYRQWYLSPDVDFTKIKTKKKAVRVLFTVLSAFKFPAPSVEFSNGKFTINALHF